MNVRTGEEFHTRENLRDERRKVHFSVSQSDSKPLLETSVCKRPLTNIRLACFSAAPSYIT
jgi:hypothetical protein